MGLWHLIVGEAIIWMLFHGTWTEGLPWWMSWGGYIGAAILVGIFSFDTGDNKD